MQKNGVDAERIKFSAAEGGQFSFSSGFLIYIFLAEGFSFEKRGGYPHTGTSPLKWAEK